MNLCIPSEHPKGYFSLGGDELIDFCTKLQSQTLLDNAAKIQRELVNVSSSMGAANILASEGLKEVFTTASSPVPPVSSFVPTVAATTSEKDNNVADLLTKPFDVGRFQYLVAEHVMKRLLWCIKSGITSCCKSYCLGMGYKDTSMDRLFLETQGHDH
ncbi:hypothetical protein Tco_0601539 [Tanacetum coccineum]